MSTTFCCLFAILCSIIVPVVLSIFYVHKQKGSLKVVLLGAFTFFFFQLLIRIPLLGMLVDVNWFYIMTVTNSLGYCAFLGITAGFFEEVGRFLVMKYMLKGFCSTKDAIGFGLGHGGIEAILFVGINAIFALFTSVPSISDGDYLLGGFERLCTLVIHVGLSVLVAKSVRLKKYSFLVLAICIHSLLDFITAYLIQKGSSFVLVYGITIAFTVALGLYTVIQQKKDVCYDEKNN